MKSFKLVLFIQDSLRSNEIDLYSKKPPHDLFLEIKSICDEKSIFTIDPNLAGQIDSKYNFELTKKRQLGGGFSIGGFAGMNAEIKGRIVDNQTGSKISLKVIPNSAFRLLFIAGMLSTTIIILLTIFGMRDEDSLNVILIALCMICPYSVFTSHYSKKSLAQTFISTFKLTSDLE